MLIQIPKLAAIVCFALLLVPAGSRANAQPGNAPLQGDTIVRTPGRALYPKGGTLVPELTVGVASGRDEYMFGTIDDILETRQGSILVLDGQSMALREYDAKGTYIRTIGGRGQGPGEFTKPGALAELQDGRRLLVDAGTVRVNVYATTGESVATWRLASDRTSVTPIGVVVDVSGTAVVSVQSWQVSAAGLQITPGLLRFAPDGALIDTVQAPEFGYQPPTVSVRRGGETASAGIPFFPRPVWAWSPLGYLVTGLPTRYAFELRIPRVMPAPRSAARPGERPHAPPSQWQSGDPVVSIRHSAPPVPVSAEQRALERTRIEASLRRLNPSWIYSGPDVPRVKPPYTHFWIGEDGTVWVRLSTPGERHLTDPSNRSSGGRGGARSNTALSSEPEWREPVVYDVFDPEGRYLGRVNVPERVSLRRAGKERVWGAVADEDGVQVVKRFRLDWR